MRRRRSEGGDGDDGCRRRPNISVSTGLAGGPSGLPCYDRVPQRPGTPLQTTQHLALTVPPLLFTPWQSQELQLVAAGLQLGPS